MRTKSIKPRVTSNADETPARNGLRDRITVQPNRKGAAAPTNGVAIPSLPNGRNLTTKVDGTKLIGHLTKGHALSSAVKPEHAPPAIPPRKERLVPQQLRDKYAETGDILTLFRAITACDMDTLMDQQKEYGRLFRLIRQRAKVDPAACGEEALRYSIGLLHYLGLRTAGQIERLIRRNDRGRRCPDVAVVPAEVEKELLPSFMSIQRSLAELLHLQAATERQRELTRCKRLENQETEARLRFSNRTLNGFNHLASSTTDVELSQTVQDPEAEIELACAGDDFLGIPKLLVGDPNDEDWDP